MGVLIVKNNYGYTKGIFTDGDIKRLVKKNQNFYNLKVKEIMNKNPISVEKNTLAAKALSIMNEKKITSLLVVSDKDLSRKNKNLIGIIHIHFLLQNGIK